MSPQPFCLSFDVYHSDIRTSKRVTVASNTDKIWVLPNSRERAYPRTDGWWGPHEYAVLPQPFDTSSPYLAWIPSLNDYDNPHFAQWSGIDPTIVRLDFTQYPLIPCSEYYHIVATHGASPPHHSSLPSKPQKSSVKSKALDFCVTSPAMTLVVKTQVDRLIDSVRQLVIQLEDERDICFIRRPEQAMLYLKQAYYWSALPGANTERAHRLILAGMKRAAMELHGFVLWYRDHRLSVNARPMIKKYRKWFCARGAVVDNEKDYAFLAMRDIPVWMQIELSQFKPPPPSGRLVPLTTLPIHRDLMFPLGYKGGHHTAIFFYPPEVEHYSDFELAARGYAGRLDVQRPNTRIADLHDRIHQHQKISAGMWFPRLKGPIDQLVQMYQQDYDNIQPFSPIPPLHDWFFGRQQMEWPPSLPFSSTGASRPPSVKSALPPPLLFFRCARQARQESYFFIWMTIREHWIHRFAAAKGVARQNFFKTHQEWRDILSGTVFAKARHVIYQYSLRFFWHANTLLIFDEKPGQDYAPLLGDGTRLVPNDFRDSNPHAFQLKRLICYDTALMHLQYQFEETDDIFLCNMDHYSAEQQAHRRVERSKLFRSNIRLLKECPPWEHPDLAIRSCWFEQFRAFLCDWPPAGSHKHPHLTVQLTGIDDKVFVKELNELFITYYSGVAKALHVVPTLMWTFPGLQHLPERYLAL